MVFFFAPGTLSSIVLEVASSLMGKVATPDLISCVF
jgi:hypothetical protein